MTRQWNMHDILLHRHHHLLHSQYNWRHWRYICCKGTIICCTGSVICCTSRQANPRWRTQVTIQSEDFKPKIQSPQSQVKQSKDPKLKLSQTSLAKDPNSKTPSQATGAGRRGHRALRGCSVLHALTHIDWPKERRLRSVGGRVPPRGERVCLIHKIGWPLPHAGAARLGTLRTDPCQSPFTDPEFLFVFDICCLRTCWSTIAPI